MATRVKNTLAFDPRSISGLQLWLDAFDPNANKTVPADSTNVSTWSDKSGNGYNFTSSPTPPTYLTVGSLKFINFTRSSGNYMMNTTLKPLMTNFTLFLVFQRKSAPADNHRLFVAIPTAYATDWNTTSGLSINTALEVASNGGGTAYSDTANLTLEFIVVNASSNTANLYKNGGPSIITRSLGITTTSVGILLGSGTNGGINTLSEIFDGYMGEVIFFTRSLTTSEQKQIEGYLAWKWGLNASIPNTHPFKNAIVPFPYTYTPTKTKNTAFPYLDPRSIPGCALWLDAADLSTLTYASGSNVSIWKDKTANIQAQHLTTAMAQARNASSTGATNYPVSGYSINGVNALYFNQSILQAITTQNVTTRSYFFVFQLPQATAEDNIILWPGTWVTGYARGASFTASSTNLLYWSNQNVAHLPVNLNINALNPTLASGTFNNGTTELYNAGNPTTNATGQSSTSFGLSGSSDNYLWIGGGSGFFSTNGFYLGEFLVYNSALSTSQRQQIEGYLAWKWGIKRNLPSNHLHLSYPPNTFQLSAPRKAVAQRAPRTFTQTFTYTGSLQTFNVPSNVTSMTVYLWGAGGGGAYVSGGFTPGNGGAGAMVQGILSVTGGSTVYIVVGKAGAFAEVNNQADATGGGGMAYYDGTLSGYTGLGSSGWGAGSGGGRSAIQFSSGGADQVVAGGGGGGGVVGSGQASGGAATFSGTANGGTSAGGGTQTAGGSAGNSNGLAGSQKLGGGGWTRVSNFGGGGGGGGYYGGGGGGNPNAYSSGGGGSSFTGNLSAISGQPLGYNSSNGQAAPNTSSSYYQSGVAVGGSASSSAGTPGTSFAGGNGLVVLVYSS